MDFQNGDIVKVPDYRTSRFRLSGVKLDYGEYGWASFDPVKKDGTRDTRWDIGFSGSLYGCTLVERPTQAT